MVVHRSQLYAVPEILSDEEAVIAEPFACALHAALKCPLEKDATILILGCGTIGLLTIAGSRIIFAPYNVAPHVIEDARMVLFVFAGFLAISTFNMVIIVGVLRSGGDTLFCLVLDLVAVYLIGLPLALLGAAVWKLPIAGVFALVTLQEVFKLVSCLKRFVSKRWINNLVKELSPGPAPSGG